jgi:type IV fimbrial biogenesis protein FimT
MQTLCREQQGFTLWELMAALLVIGIVFGLGVPNFTNFTRNARMASAVNSLVSALHLSRTEAVKRQAPVTICGSSNPLAAAPLCDGGRGGFFAFADLDDIDGDGFADGDGELNGADAIILRRDAPHESIDFFADGDNTYIAYGANGFLIQYGALGQPATTFLFCDARGNADSGIDESVARVVSVSGTGRPQLLTARAAVAAAVAATGGSCP